MEQCEEHELWGYHLVMNCKAGNQNTRDEDKIREFVSELVPAVNMEAYGEPQLVHFGKDNKAGWTLVQLITTSNICCHFCDDTGDFYFDLFSCKPFEVIKVRELICKYFAPKQNKELLLKRGI